MLWTVLAPVFVCGMPLQPSLIFVSKVGLCFSFMSTGAPLLGEASNLDKTERAHYIQTPQLFVQSICDEVHSYTMGTLNFPE